MKKILTILILLIIVFTMTACDKKEEKEIKDDTPVMEHMHCTRTGTIDDASSATMSYEVYYTGDIINRIESIERVTSTSSATLDTYEKAYRDIHSHYDDIENYKTEVIRTNTTVTSYMDIDYDNIDIEKLIELEGTETNIFEDNKPKLSKYNELIKNLGVKCQKAS